MLSDSGRTLTQRTYLNAAASMARLGATVLVGFVINPILLSSLGSTLFGTWKICQRLLTYMAAADGRSTQALKWTIANKQSVDDVEAKRRDVGCALTVWLRFLPFVVILGSLLAWFSPLMISGLPSDYITVVRLTCAILVLNMILLPIQTIPEAALIGVNLAYRCTWINVVASILGGVFMVVAVLMGFGLIGLASAILCVSLVRGAALVILARRSILWLGIRRPKKDEVSNFFNFSIWVLAWSFILKLMLSCDILILGFISSADKVASYVLTYYLVLMAITFSSMFVSAATPGLGDIVGQKDYARAASVRSEIHLFSWLINVVLGSMILLWNFSFVSLWVGPENFVGHVENLLIVVLMVQLIFIRNDSQIVDVTLNIKTKVLFGALSAIVSIGLAGLLCSIMNQSVVGLVIGLVTGRLIITVAYPLLVDRAFQRKSVLLSGALIRPAFVMGSLFAATSYVGTQVIIDGWFRLATYSVLSSILIMGAAFFTGLSTQQRQQVKVRLDQLRFARLFAGQRRESNA